MRECYTFGICSVRRSNVENSRALPFLTANDLLTWQIFLEAKISERLDTKDNFENSKAAFGFERTTNRNKSTEAWKHRFTMLQFNSEEPKEIAWRQFCFLFFRFQNRTALSSTTSMKKGGGNAEGQCCDELYTNPINLFFKGGRDFRKKGINNLVALRSSDLVQKQGT